jgi:uncharacterized protein DUF6069
MGGWATARGLGQSLMVVGRGDGPVAVPLGAVAVATVAGGVAGWGMAVLAARTSRPRAAFLAGVVAGLVLSTVPPLAGATDTVTAVWLLVLHAVVAASIVPPLATALPWRQSTSGPNRAPVETVAIPTSGAEESR